MLVSNIKVEIMKYIYTCFIILTLGLFVACDDFLDVKSDQELFQDESLEKPEGVHMYVNGIYRQLSATSLYGRELTWGLASVLGNNYAATSITYLGTAYYYASKFTWSNSDVKSTMKNIWASGYTAIANINNLLQEVLKKDTTFFEYGSYEKDMIVGELYGLRALVHFDLLRLFGPAPITNPTGLVMPYVTVFPDKHPEHKSVNDVLSAAIEDMKKSRELLERVDFEFCGKWYNNFAANIKRSNTAAGAPPGDFYNYRSMRMNYFAVNGLLARMYMYKGDYKNAYVCADSAINMGWRMDDWSTSKEQYSATPTSQAPKRWKELLLCFSNSDSWDNWELYTNKGVNYMTMNDKYVTELFGEDVDDYRFRGFYGTQKGRYNANKRWMVWERPVVTGSETIPVDYSDQMSLLPVLRNTELYHILIECLLHDGKTEEATEWLNYFRGNRGCKLTIDEGLSKEELLEILYNDIIRETLTEGQTFFMFKRLNRDIYNGASNIEMTPENWYSPIPDEETSYL